MRRSVALFEDLLDGRDYLFGEFGAADVIAFPFLKYAVFGLPPGDDDRFHEILVEHQPLAAELAPAGVGRARRRAPPQLAWLSAVLHLPELQAAVDRHRRATRASTTQAVSCHHCGFGFLFELMDDYYPAPDAGFVVCDKEGRILAIGRGVFELTGWNESDLIGVDVVEGLGLGGFEEEKNPAKLALEWGVRRLNEALELKRAPADEAGHGPTSSPPTTTTAACSWL